MSTPVTKETVFHYLEFVNNKGDNLTEDPHVLAHEILNTHYKGLSRDNTEVEAIASWAKQWQKAEKAIRAVGL